MLEQHLIGAIEDCHDPTKSTDSIYTRVPWTSVPRPADEKKCEDQTNDQKLARTICSERYYLEKTSETSYDKLPPLSRIKEPLKVEKIEGLSRISPISAFDFKIIDSDVLLFIATESGMVFKALLKVRVAIL